MATPFSSSSRMDAWSERRGLQTMNLRSVFTAEQQRILERYYDNGMTNQSKACFQLILQCAQETKLDFSVVRTWVGNKRRKLASKVDQNGGMSHSLSNHGLAGGILSNHALAGGALTNHSLAGGALVAGAMLTAEMAAARNIQGRPHLLPPSNAFPSSSSSSCSTSSSSPLSCGNNNNNNNDVILTGIYSLNASPRPRPRLALPQASAVDPEVSAQALLSQSLHSRNSSTSSPLQSKLATLPHKPPSLATPPGPSVFATARKGPFSMGEPVAAAARNSGTGGVPHSWARQYGTVQARAWPSPPQSQVQLQPRPHSNPQPHPPAPPRAPVTLPVPNLASSSDQNLRIQQVFTLSDRTEAEGPKQVLSSNRRSQANQRQTPRPQDSSGCFSIAMETGDEEDEWQREEALANMASQSHNHRGHTSTSHSPPRVDLTGVRGGHTPPFPSSRPAPHHSTTPQRGSYPLTAQTSPTRECSSPTSVSASAAPWLYSNCRKRTLQDRTQFSDGDLIQLKRYWDRGMTSLGSVCREKITAAASQLSVDTEIVKTWISNRRRKYRLMGIEIPPPKGGPAVFSTSSPGNESPVALSPDAAGVQEPDLGEDLNDSGSLILSEDGTNDSYQREGEDGSDGASITPLANNVKIEIIDEGDDDDDGEFIASDMEQMQNLLEFKHEEVQFLEQELENQKQKYLELEHFTKSLLSAVRSNNLEKQQELIASLPQPADQDWNMTPEGGGSQPAAMTTEASPNHDESSMPTASSDEAPLVPTNEDFPLVTINEDGSTTAITGSSASEEQLEETVTEEE